MRQLEIQVPSSDAEGEGPRSKDWLSQAISTEFADPDARRCVTYSLYISRLEAIELAAQAIADANHVGQVAHDYCDKEGLYGAARREVIDRVIEESRWIDDFLS